MRKAVFIQAWTRCKPFNRFEPTFWAMRTTRMQAQCKDKSTSRGNEVQMHNYKSLFQSTGTARNDAFNHRRAKVQLLTYFQVGHWVASRNSVPWCCRTTAIPSAPPRHAWQNLAIQTQNSSCNIDTRVCSDFVYEYQDKLPKKQLHTMMSRISHVYSFSYGNSHRIYQISLVPWCRGWP